MLKRNYFQILFILSALLQFAWTYNVSVQEDTSSEISELNQEEGFITCQCGSNKQLLRKSLNVTFVEMFFSKIAILHENLSANFKDNSDIKEYMGKCSWCQISFNRCFQNSSSADGLHFCVKKSVDFNVSENNGTGSSLNDTKAIVEQTTETFPKVIDIPIGGDKNYSRQIRHAEACTFPTSLETAALNCRIFPSSVKCTQRCAFGYTLDNGIQQTMQCLKKENRWKPTGFKECQPFVDCTIALISAGSAKCSTATLLNGPQCTVECLHYEDKDPVPQNTYSCSIDGSWDPPLPFCAVRGTSLVLANAPSVKLHRETN